jgi:hypothetical protein
VYALVWAGAKTRRRQPLPEVGMQDTRN